VKTFVYLYHADVSTPPSDESMQAWGAWMQALGAHLVDGGNPINGAKASLSGGQVLQGTDLDDDVIGYSIIKADDMAQAIALATGNPLADAPGCAVTVYETGQM
jgi:hypothetical protein